jgi:hypothetical protein
MHWLVKEMYERLNMHGMNNIKCILYLTTLSIAKVTQGQK